MKGLSLALLVVTVAAIVIIATVSLHSVWEIHYLKSFYPSHFTVSEVGWAAVVELIKVALVSLPLVLVISVCLHLRRLLRQGQ